MAYGSFVSKGVAAVSVATNIRKYVEQSIQEDFLDAEVIPPLFDAVRDAVSDDELRYLGLALIARWRAMTDGTIDNEDLQAIARDLGA